VVEKESGVNAAEFSVAYAPYAPGMNSPGDRRRFGFYAAASGITLQEADPGRDYDLVYLSTRADLTAWAKYRGRAKIVFEVIDSYLALPENDPKNKLRGLAKYLSGEVSKPILSYRRALIEMATRADAVVCSTEEQKQQLSQFCPNVHIILDVHDEVGPMRKEDYCARAPFNLVWEGLAYTLDAFDTIAPALERIARRHPIALHLVTDLHSHRYLGRFWGVDTEKRARRIFKNTFVYQWNPLMLAPIATRCDLALIPLDLTDPFSRGKPENKLLLFWRMGMPTITSASPAYDRAMRACGLDMTCNTLPEWESTIEEYLLTEDLRQQAGSKGARFAESFHSRGQVFERWEQLIAATLESPPIGTSTDEN